MWSKNRILSVLVEYKEESLEQGLEFTLGSTSEEDIKKLFVEIMDDVILFVEVGMEE